MGSSRPWEAYLAQRRDADFTELLDFVAIPSISTEPKHASDVARAGQWVADRMRRAGVPEVRILDTPGHPVVYGRWHAAPGKPTVLVYGHYDVQPVDPLDLWETPPFAPSRRDGRIYARGVADMKANLATLLQAVEALAATGNGAPGVNLTFLFEGEEEIGSPNLPAVVAAHRELLACDVALSADGGQAGADLPELLVALKGICSLQVDLRTSSTDLHSGAYGAAVPNAVQTLVQLASTLHHPDGRVAVAGFYDRVRDLTPQDREEIAATDEGDAVLMAEAGVSGLWGEPGYTAQERRSARPTVDLNGIWGGFQGEGTKTVTPAEAHLKITCRLVADQDPNEIVELVKRHLEQHAPAGAQLTIRPGGARAKPFMVNRANPALETARTVMAEIYGREPVVTRSGGSVPITEVFQRELGVETVTIGFALPGSRAHAPNEWYQEDQFDLSRRVYAAYIEALGSV